MLDSFVNSINSLTELLSIKNAQMEAETEEEIEILPEKLKQTDFIRCKSKSRMVSA